MSFRLVVNIILIWNVIMAQNTPDNDSLCGYYNNSEIDIIDCTNDKCIDNKICCIDYKDCNIDCSYGGCHDMIIYAGIETVTTIHCGGIESCSGITIHAEDSMQLVITMNETMDNKYALKNGNIYCPENDGMNNDSCIVNCGDCNGPFSSCIDMNVYSRKGFADMQLISNNDACCSYGNKCLMFCGLSYDNNCSISEFSNNKCEVHSPCDNSIISENNFTVYPSFIPTITPTILPSQSPTNEPTIKPSLSPSLTNTISPSKTLSPTMEPSFKIDTFMDNNITSNWFVNHKLFLIISGSILVIICIIACIMMSYIIHQYKLQLNASNKKDEIVKPMELCVMTSKHCESHVITTTSNEISNITIEPDGEILQTGDDNYKHDMMIQASYYLDRQRSNDPNYTIPTASDEGTITPNCDEGTITPNNDNDTNLSINTYVE